MVIISKIQAGPSNEEFGGTIRYEKNIFRQSVQLHQSRNNIIGIVGRVFTNALGDLSSIPLRVIPKTFKMVLDTS